MIEAIQRILALAEDERADGEFEGPEHEEWRAEMRALILLELRTYHDALSSLVTSVNTYLDHPGCNNPAKATAMAKLRWAMDEARKKL